MPSHYRKEQMSVKVKRLGGRWGIKESTKGWWYKKFAYPWYIAFFQIITQSQEQQSLLRSQNTNTANDSRAYCLQLSSSSVSVLARMDSTLASIILRIDSQLAELDRRISLKISNLSFLKFSV
ncbi:hypothetical protein T07_11055 [Trichinella nelsoni]|uniref:Uncharacterized protein n=1 Tax=Trichinella nelsoni TaxID=6336 RepID=A0A0V0S1Y8_9BILA|nr:hypothetical protein T07_11055 [Trichinella nelsoni]